MAIYNVTNATQFQSALSRAIGGDSIVLAGGNYGTVNINNRSFASNVTIQSSRSQAPAHFDGLFISNSKNMTLSGLDLGRSLRPGEADYTTLNSISNSTNIRLTSSRIHGSLDGNPKNDGNGLYARDNQGLVLTGNTFEDLYRGSFIQRSSDTIVANNVFKTMRADGATFSAMSNVTIDGNVFRDYQPAAGDHADGIQFWNTNETRGSNNVTIKNNIVWQGSGTGTQGIFLGDPLSYGYHNVQIENNLIYSNDQYEGILVAGGNTVYLIGNTVLSKSSDGKQNWVRLHDTSNVMVKDNVSDNFVQTGKTTDIWSDHNLFLSKNPALKTQIPNLVSPTSIQDLLVNGYGYKPVTVSDRSKLSLENVLEARPDPELIFLPSVTASNGLAESEQVGSLPLKDRLSPVREADAGDFGLSQVSLPFSLDHFVALP